MSRGLSSSQVKGWGRSTLGRTDPLCKDSGTTQPRVAMEELKGGQCGRGTEHEGDEVREATTGRHSASRRALEFKVRIGLHSQGHRKPLKGLRQRGAMI